jgi:hypothetical protein
MTKPTPESGNTIERLLQDRSQFVSWLTKLNATGETTPAVPEAVRSRVRADYERRLDAVLEELRGHTASLEEQVEDLSTRAGLLTSRENEHKEQLSEAEVRHLVGEYDEGKWEGIRAELMKVINQIRSELNHTTSEIDRLNEVLATIRAPIPVSPVSQPEPELEPEPEPEPEAVLLMEPEPEPEIVLAPPPPPIVSAPRPGVTTSAPRPVVPPEALSPKPEPPVEPARPAASAAPGTTEIPFRPVPPRPQPKPPAAAPPKKDDQPSRTLWFPSGKPNDQGTGGAKLDELAFLKSVTGNEPPAAQPAPPPPAPKPSRASGGFTKPPEAAPPMTTAPAPAVEPPAAKAPAEPKDRSSGSGQKTLKCGECGTLNRPTEWYCERCGAELAAL